MRGEFWVSQRLLLALTDGYWHDGADRGRADHCRAHGAGVSGRGDAHRVEAVATALRKGIIE